MTKTEFEELWSKINYTDEYDIKELLTFHILGQDELVPYNWKNFRKHDRIKNMFVVSGYDLEGKYQEDLIPEYRIYTVTYGDDIIFDRRYVLENVKKQEGRKIDTEIVIPEISEIVDWNNIETITEVPTFEELIFFERRGLIRLREHPEKSDVYLAKYTDDGFSMVNVYPKLRWCRAHVYSIDFDVGEAVRISNPFPKFFNLNENENVREELFDWNTAEMFRKYDGFMIQVFMMDDDIIFTTTGSWGDYDPDYVYFEFIDEAKRIAEEKGYMSIIEGFFEECGSHYTLLFEVLTPDFTIIEEHEEEDLIFLMVRDDNGNNMDLFHKLCLYYGLNGAEIISFGDGRCLSYLKREQVNDNSDQEGFVVHINYLNGDPTMIKVKRDKYVKMHRLTSYRFNNRKTKEDLLGSYLYKLIREDGIYAFAEFFNEIPVTMKDDFEPIRHRILDRCWELTDEAEENFEKYDFQSKKDIGLNDDIDWDKKRFFYYNIFDKDNPEEVARRIMSYVLKIGDF